MSFLSVAYIMPEHFIGIIGELHGFGEPGMNFFVQRLCLLLVLSKVISRVFLLQTSILAFSTSLGLVLAL